MTDNNGQHPKLWNLEKFIPRLLYDQMGELKGVVNDRFHSIFELLSPSVIWEVWYHKQYVKW